MSRSLTIALVRDVFFDETGPERLRDRLRESRTQGAALALLPEIPLNRWSPATTNVRDDDAEPPGGPRHQILARAARAAGIALVGGAIVREPATGVRHNTALVFDARGELIARYAKVHLPDEDGFREPCHYAPGTRMADVIDAFALPVGVQICSDMNRPEGSHLLGAMGAMAILNPRATQAATFERWKLIFRANAMTSCAYVLSVSRPGPEQDVPIGGASIAVDPDGTVILETAEPVACATVEESAVERAKRRYPGYLDVNADLYARAWSRVAERK